MLLTARRSLYRYQSQLRCTYLLALGNTIAAMFCTVSQFGKASVSAWILPLKTPSERFNAFNALNTVLLLAVPAAQACARITAVSMQTFYKRFISALPALYQLGWWGRLSRICLPKSSRLQQEKCLNTLFQCPCLCLAGVTHCAPPRKTHSTTSTNRRQMALWATRISVIFCRLAKLAIDFPHSQSLITQLTCVHVT